jgi:hypothetical protein
VVKDYIFFRLHTFNIYQKMSLVSNRPKGELSPNLVTLEPSEERFSARKKGRKKGQKVKKVKKVSPPPTN